MNDPTLMRLRQVDWSSQPEATVSSQLITPVLMLLGYGEHTLHKVAEQQVYALKDPTTSKGSRRVKLDYQPRVYEQGLWVMEAKGTDAAVTRKTLGQVRDYAVHPEIRAALMVTVDRAGFQVFDPWDKDWDEPLLTVAPNEVADRIDELRAVLGADQVPGVVKRRHLDHLRRALSASLEFGVLDEVQQDFQELIAEVRADIDRRRRDIERDSMREAEELHQRVLNQSGAWGVAQHHNSPWIGTHRETTDLAIAVLAQPERQRLTEIRSYWPAIDAVYEKRVTPGESPRRPLWWAHVVALAGGLGLRGQDGCEPDATALARQSIRDCLLSFPDDPVAAASWRLQRVALPLLCRMGGFFPLERMSADTQKAMSAEQRLRRRIDPSWFLGHSVRMGAIRLLSGVSPWTVEELDRLAQETREMLARTPLPQAQWHGPVTDPWLSSWETRDDLLMCGLAVLQGHGSGDDLIAADEALVKAVVDAAASDDAVIRRPAQPLAARLGLS